MAIGGLGLAGALICYSLATLFFALYQSSPGGRLGQAAIVSLAAAAILHGADLAARAVQAGTLPVASFNQSLSFLAWLTAVVGLYLIVRMRMAVIGAFVAPASAIALFVGYDRGGTKPHPIPQALRSIWLPIHVSLAFLGEALLVLAAAVSLVYLIQESRLKGHRPLLTGDSRVPSLEKLDRINYRLLGWGFVLLSLAMLSGGLWAEDTWGRFWSWEPRELWSLITWLLYAGLLESRLAVGWRGRRAATITIVGFGVLLGSYLGVSLVAPGKHGGSFG